MENIIINISAGLLIAAGSSWITVQLTHKKFRIEKWWERKADAYANIIEAIYNSKRFSEEHLGALERGHDLPNDKDDQLRKVAREGFSEIQRAASIGAFLLSDEAIVRLAQLRREGAEASQTDSWVQYLEADLSATESCLQDIIEIAKADLKV